MRLALALGLALAACSAPAQPPAHPAPEAPPARAPTIEWSAADRAFVATRLPAAASDGSLVVFAHVDADGGRGNPNLTLVARDRSDRVVQQLVVLDANAGDAIAEQPAALAACLERGRAWLDALHAKHRLVALAPLAAEPGATQHVATGGDITLDWLPGIVEVRRAGATLASQKTPAAWLAPDHPMCATCGGEVCHNPAFLRGGAVDVERKLALVVIAYTGSDSCWEPADQEHVVAW